MHKSPRNTESGGRNLSQGGSEEQRSLVQLVHATAMCPLIISHQGGVKYIAKSVESKRTHTPEDKPVTNILLDGGAEEFDRETKDPRFSLQSHLQPPHRPVCTRLSPEQQQQTPNEKPTKTKTNQTKTQQTKPSFPSDGCPAVHASDFGSNPSAGIPFPFLTLGFNMCYFWTDSRCY